MWVCRRPGCLDAAGMCMCVCGSGVGRGVRGRTDVAVLQVVCVCSVLLMECRVSVCLCVMSDDWWWMCRDAVHEQLLGCGAARGRLGLAGAVGKTGEGEG
eukprot:COSAG01_NODE_734_length_13974_cov_57.831784_2_plen_100_part_00